MAAMASIGPRNRYARGSRGQLKQSLGAARRRALHDAGSGRSAASARAGQHVGAQVDGENLDDGQRQRNLNSTKARYGTSSGTLEARM